MGSEKLGHLRHGGYTAHVPQTDVVVEEIRTKEHLPVRRHAAHGGRDGGRTHRQVTVHGSGAGREWDG